MAYHRQDAKKKRQTTLIYPLMSKYGIENRYIELFEECPCKNSNPLEKREGELMRELKAFLNQKVAGRTTEEYQVDCADKIKKAKAVSDLKKQKSMLKKTKTN
jgi:hypothetical protein